MRALLLIQLFQKYLAIFVFSNYLHLRTSWSIYANLTWILTLYPANAPTLMRCNILKHTPKLIIFGTHNLHTFEHNTLINELLLMQFYFFNIPPKLRHRKWRKLRVTLPVNFVKIDHYNFELYGFKVGTFFWDGVVVVAGDSLTHSQCTDRVQTDAVCTGCNRSEVHWNAATNC